MIDSCCLSLDDAFELFGNFELMGFFPYIEEDFKSTGWVCAAMQLKCVQIAELNHNFKNSFTLITLALAFSIEKPTFSMVWVTELK